MTVQAATATCKLSCWDAAIDLILHSLVRSVLTGPAILLENGDMVLCDFCVVFALLVVFITPKCFVKLHFG